MATAGLVRLVPLPCASPRRRRPIAPGSSRRRSPSSPRAASRARAWTRSRRARSTTRALINYYFGSKEQLYLAVLERVLRRDPRSRERARRSSTCRRSTRSAASCEFTYNYYVEHEYFVRLVVAENQAKGRHMKRFPSLRTINRPIVDMLGAVIARGQADGDVPCAISIRSTSTWRSPPWGCSTSPISTPSAPSSSGPWARREMCRVAAAWWPT